MFHISIDFVLYGADRHMYSKRVLLEVREFPSQKFLKCWDIQRVCQVSHCGFELCFYFQSWMELMRPPFFPDKEKNTHTNRLKSLSTTCNLSRCFFHFTCFRSLINFHTLEGIMQTFIKFRYRAPINAFYYEWSLIIIYYVHSFHWNFNRVSIEARLY